MQHNITDIFDSNVNNIKQTMDNLVVKALI